MKMIYLFVCIAALTSCNQGGNQVEVTKRIDTIPKKSIPSVKPKLNYKHFYTSWIPVSIHHHDTTDMLLSPGRYLDRVFKNNGDTGIQSFIADTAKYKAFYEEYVTFQKNGQWTDFTGDVGGSGKFTLDTINNVFTPNEFPFSRSVQIDTVLDYKLGILYLDEHFLLLDWYYGKEKFIYFYINEKYAVKKNKWRFVGGG